MRKLIFLGFLFFSLTSIAQNLPKFSSYGQLQNIINPAAIFDDVPTIKTFYRAQWIGLEGAPSIGGFDATFKNNKSAFGAFFLNDKAGIFTQNIFHLNYAYSLRVSYDTYMNFGLSGGFNIYKLNYQDLILYHPNDPYIGTTANSAFLPDINFGTMFTNIRNSSDFAFNSLAKRFPIYYAGFSIQHILGVIANNEVAKDNSYMNRHYNLMGSIMHPLGVSFQIQETMLLKYTPNAPAQLDLGANIFFQEHFWGGVAYRTSNDIILNFGVKYKYLIFNYAFDFSFFKIPNFSSHEFILGFRILGKNYMSKY